MTLNMLHTSRQNPEILAYEDMDGPFDYTKTPIAPIGMPDVKYDNPGVQGTSAPHGTDDFLCGTSNATLSKPTLLNSHDEAISNHCIVRAIISPLCGTDALKGRPDAVGGTRSSGLGAI